ncbi:Carcinoembryonic antigen-related cell adhesion molecule 1 [Dissostichus eleginoides]|uniref:Carcinoembryonic antigen-related cell adhesion molecule 1 n=1 Tax=Dissostichus eleginoides TaxID=100907 RepID=A0AAD9FHY2_DISEL|nr:Carcinoembryonic antigen-related cell adhesion molecule 1 [Dissostichus eleginoides]
MDHTYTSKKMGGNWNQCRLLMLLFLTVLQPGLSADGEEPELDDDDNRVEISCAIVGPDYVTVGVPSSVECLSNCKACTFSMSVDSKTAQGQGSVLAFTVSSWVGVLTVTCTAAEDGRGGSATATKKLQVLDGPANVSITGPSRLTQSVSHTYSCHARCRPSCTYAWRTDEGPWIGGQGNVLSITPQEMDKPKTLVCKATNSVSGLFVAATQNITVTYGPSEIQIIGPDVISISEKQQFVCSAECLPSCRYVSSVNSHTVRGNVMEVTVDHPLKSVTLKCEAQNTASRKKATVTKTIHISGSFHSLSSRPEGSSVLLAFILSAAHTVTALHYGSSLL